MTAELRAWLIEEARRGVRYTYMGADDELESLLDPESDAWERTK
jgi:hypothetical protein